MEAFLSGVKPENRAVRPKAWSALRQVLGCTVYLHASYNKRMRVIAPRLDRFSKKARLLHNQRGWEHRTPTEPSAEKKGCRRDHSTCALFGIWNLKPSRLWSYRVLTVLPHRWIMIQDKVWNRGIFYCVTFSVADHFFPITKKNAWFFRDKIDMGT